MQDYALQNPPHLHVLSVSNLNNCKLMLSLKGHLHNILSLICTIIYIVVLHGNATLSLTHRAIDCFSKVLSQSSSFARAGEIHLRLGVMFKTKGEYLLSMDHFQKALTITGPASFSRLESKYVNVESERERERSQDL